MFYDSLFREAQNLKGLGAEESRRDAPKLFEGRFAPSLLFTNSRLN
jgi:hypothetical protein